MFSREPPGSSGSNLGYSGRGSSSGDWDYRERKLDPKEELRQLAEKDLESATKLAKSRGMDLATIVDVPALAKRQAAREAAAKERQEGQRAAEIAGKGKETRAKLDRAASRAEMARHALETDPDKHQLYLLRRGATDITLSLKELQSIASEVPEHEGIRDEIFSATSRFVPAAKGFLDCTTHHKLKDKRLGELAEQINAFMRKMVKVGWDESSYSSSDHRSGDKYPQQADQTIVSGNSTRFRNLLATVPVEKSGRTQQPSPTVQRSRAPASRTIQRSSKIATKTAPTTSSPPNSTIDPPQPAINKPGFIDNDDGSNIRTGPAELDGKVLTAQPLPPATRVFVSGHHPEAPTWWYVIAHLPEVIVSGYVQNFRVNTDLPEPSAKLYQIKSGDTAHALARREFSASVRDGHDLRYYENVLLAVNRDKNRAGVKGTFQEPGIFGGGANNIQLEAGRRIWLVSPAYVS
ncbi:MAG: hypothetical protein MJE77_46720 [Proteobacteria bacterium]|nr:hypothetical protein [Pseudomonadota bacterium]